MCIYWGLGVVHIAEDEIYISISIGKYIIPFHLFSVCCAKESFVVKNIQSEVATWKIVTIMQRW